LLGAALGLDRSGNAGADSFGRSHIRDRVAQPVMGESACQRRRTATIVTFAVLAAAMGNAEFSPDGVPVSVGETIRHRHRGRLSRSAISPRLLIAHESGAFLAEYAPVDDARRRHRRLFRRQSACQASGFMAGCSLFGHRTCNKEAVGFRIGNWRSAKARRVRLDHGVQSCACSFSSCSARKSILP